MDTEDTVIPIPKVVERILVLSLVTLFLSSLVTTWPSGDLLAKETEDCGLSSGLSISCWGYKSVTFWLYFKEVKVSGIALSAESV